MNQLFYNIVGGIVHQIRRKNRTTISEVTVHGKRNIKQNRNWIYFKFCVESSCLFYCSLKLIQNSLFLKKKPRSRMAKRFAHAISVHYRDFQHTYV